MKSLLIVLLLAAIAFAAFYEDLVTKHTKEHQKKKNPKWKTGKHRRFEGKTKEQLQRSLGMKRGGKRGVRSTDEHFRWARQVNLPINFDARTKWPYCPRIRLTTDQGDCGSCWAIAGSAVFSDRFCIASLGLQKPTLSAQDMISCDKNNLGCDGAYLYAVMNFWQTKGIVSGGFLGSKEGCQPYREETYKGVTLACNQTCANAVVNYQRDKFFSSTIYQVAGGAAGIQAELMKNGPLLTGFDVYEDFFIYSSGIYERNSSGDFLGSHAVRLVGWGVQDDTPYWLVANSWGPTWGENGFFKIVRGRNECNFEAEVYGGLPNLKLLG